MSKIVEIYNILSTFVEKQKLLFVYGIIIYKHRQLLHL